VTDDIQVPVEEDIDVPTDDDLYEMWIAYPRKATFVAVANHSTYSNLAGWWCIHDRRYTAAEVRARGGVPNPPERNA